MSPRRRPSSAARLEFVARLSALLAAGLPIPDALGALAADTRRRGQAARLRRAQADVESGGDLTAALLADPALVDAATGALVLAGERSGLLIDNLETARRSCLRAQERRRRLRSAAVYPIVVIVLSMLLAFVMAVVVLPRLAATYASLGGELPPLTRGVLLVAASLRDVRTWIVVAAGLVVTTIGGRVLMRGSRRGPLDVVPIVAGVRRDLRTTVALEVVASLLRGGLPFVEALEVAAGVTDDPGVRRRLLRVASEVGGGRSVTEAVAAARLVAGWVVEVLGIGERTGGLADAVARAAEVLGERTERRAQDLATAIEPLLLAGAGALVGTVVLALYLPLFRVVDLVR